MTVADVCLERKKSARVGPDREAQRGPEGRRARGVSRRSVVWWLRNVADARRAP